MRAVERVSGTNPWKVRFRLLGRQSSRRFRTHREAVRFAAILDSDGVQAALEDLQARETAAAVPMLNQWARESIAARSGLGSGQHRDYQRVFDRTWSPLLGRMQLHEIRKADVSRALVELSERGGAKGQGLSDKSVANAHGILSGIMSDAVDAGHVLVSPCKGLKLPRRTSHESQEARFLTREEFAVLLQAAPAHWQPLIAFLAGTGCRWGEASALLVSDVHLEGGVVDIRRAVKWNGNSMASRTIGPPKTKRSRRSIALPAGFGERAGSAGGGP